MCFDNFLFICVYGDFILPQQQALSGLPFGIFKCGTACKRDPAGLIPDNKNIQ